MITVTEQLLQVARHLLVLGLNQGMAGNVSVRHAPASLNQRPGHGGGLALTPDSPPGFNPDLGLVSGLDPERVSGGGLASDLGLGTVSRTAADAVPPLDLVPRQRSMTRVFQPDPQRRGFWITPSAVPVLQMTEQSMVFMDDEGVVHGPGKPSSEWRFHRDILVSRPEVGAVIHTHSMFATTLACLRLTIPSFHYMIAQLGGEDIRCAPYALFGTQALSDGALQALEGRQACLLANHGMIAVGRDLPQALEHAQALESLCEQYWRILQIGPARLLDHKQMAQVMEQFKGYSR